MSQSIKLKLPFLKKEQSSSDTFSYFFDRKNFDFDFFPGQYMRVTLPITPTDDRGASRFFTICSSPLENDHIMITTKRGQSDFKNALYELKSQTPVDMFGPIGGFYLKDDEFYEHVFLAGGIGITPFHSMIKYVTQRNLDIPVTLIVSFSKTEEMVFYNELSELAKNHGNIKIVYTITKPELSEEKWTGETGRISESLLRKYIPDLVKPTYYIVGPPPMVEGTEQLLKDLNIPSEQIKIEQFTGY